MVPRIRTVFLRLIHHTKVMLKLIYQELQAERHDHSKAVYHLSYTTRLRISTQKVVSQLWWKCSQLVYPFMLRVHFHMDHQHLIQSQRLPAITGCTAITPRSFWDSSIIHLEGNRVSSTYERHHFIYTFEQQTFTHARIYNRSEWLQPLHRKTDNPGVSNQQVNISAGNARRKHFTHSMKHQLQLNVKGVQTEIQNEPNEMTFIWLKHVYLLVQVQQGLGVAESGRGHGSRGQNPCV